MRNARKWFALIIAIALYYVIHEGAHLLVALICGTFKEIRLIAWGLGMQVVVETTAMSDTQIWMFSIAGAAATLLTGYLMVLKRKSVLKSSNETVRAIGWYATLVLLCLDPLYLSVIHRFVGGGDFNGIILAGIPSAIIVIIFLVFMVLNLLIIKMIYPEYRQRFLKGQVQ
jgi:hypothetical protein